MKNLDLEQWQEELTRGVDSDGISPENAAGILGVGVLEVARLMDNNELDHVHVFKDHNLTQELFVVIPNYSLKRYLAEHPATDHETLATQDDLSSYEQNLMEIEFAAAGDRDDDDVVTQINSGDR